MVDLEVSAIGLTIGACTAVFGAWWAGSAHEDVTFTHWLKVRLWQASQRLKESVTQSRP